MKTQPISLKSNLWVIKQRSGLPEDLFVSFPVPQAIIFLGERKPFKALEHFAIQKEVPVVSIKETEGFLFEWKKEGWKLKTKN